MGRLTGFGFIVVIASILAAAPALAGAGELNTIADLFARLRTCGKPPPLDQALLGMQMTLSFSLKRDGSLIGPPRITYSTPGVSQETREVYFKAITDSLNVCLPLHLSDAFGGALAGKMIAWRYIDNRLSRPSVQADSPRFPTYSSHFPPLRN